MARSDATERHASGGESGAWSHARCVRQLAEVDGLEFDSFDDGTTGVAGAGGVAWISDEGIEWDGFVVEWWDVDDGIVADLVEVLVEGAPP